MFLKAGLKLKCPGIGRTGDKLSRPGGAKFSIIHSLASSSTEAFSSEFAGTIVSYFVSEFLIS